MQKQIISGVLVATATAMAGVAQAELTANVGVTSNYVFRGVTQTDDSPAVQGGIDFTHNSGLYAGIWGSNVEDNAGNDGFEYDLYVGYNFRVNDKVGFDVGYITYQYTDDAIKNARETDEIFVGVSFMDFSATYYDGDPNSGQDYSYIDLKYTLALPEDINLHLHYGSLDNGTDAEDASIGVSKNIGGFDMSLTFTTYDPDNGNDENELFITVTKAFELMK